MANDRIFELGVYDQTDEFTIPILDFLNGNEPCNWYQNDTSLLIIRNEGVEHLRETWNFGSLSRFVAQFNHLRERLEANQPAILRSAVMDQPIVPWVVFTPEGDELVISTCFVTHELLRFQFPDEAGSENLYAHVLEVPDRPQREEIVRVRTARLISEISLAQNEASEFLAKVTRNN